MYAMACAWAVGLSIPSTNLNELSAELHEDRASMDVPCGNCNIGRDGHQKQAVYVKGTSSRCVGVMDNVGVVSE